MASETEDARRVTAPWTERMVDAMRWLKLPPPPPPDGDCPLSANKSGTEDLRPDRIGAAFSGLSTSLDCRSGALSCCAAMAVLGDQDSIDILLEWDLRSRASRERMRANASADSCMSVDGCSHEKNSRALSFRSVGDHVSIDHEERRRGKKSAILDLFALFWCGGAVAS